VSIASDHDAGVWAALACCAVVEEILAAVFHRHLADAAVAGVEVIVADLDGNAKRGALGCFSFWIGGHLHTVSFWNKNTP
jgi:hypothetical protein